jgi:hypothetical protein
VLGKTRPREELRIERDYGSGETVQVCLLFFLLCPPSLLTVLRAQFWQGWIYELEGRVRPFLFSFLSSPQS